MSVSGIFTPRELVTLARSLPEPLVQDAAAGSAEHLEDDFQYPTAGLYSFGERLIFSAGLATAALYIELTKTDDPRLDHRLLGHIRTVVFHRPYDAGLATCILERVAIAGAQIKIEPDGRPECIGAFLSLKRDTPANTYRARHGTSLENALARVLKYLSYLRELSFDPSSSDSAVFHGTSVALWPFLRWDGLRLATLRETRMPQPDDDRSGGLPKRLIHVRHEDYDEREELSEALPLDRLRLAAIAERVGHHHKDDATEYHAESFIPLLVTNYSRMDNLVDLIMEEASDATKTEWVEWYLKKGARSNPTPMEIRRALRDETLLENAILACALEFDPIAVLKDYFDSEREDIPKCMRLLARDGADDILASIDGRVERVRERVEPLFVHGEQQLARLLRDHRARLASYEVARLLGFKIRHVNVRDSAEDYADRVAGFYRRMKDNPDEERLDRGLKQCCIISEEILEFIHFFYAAVSGFDRQSDTGLSIASRSILQQQAKRIAGKGLGFLIKEFRQLCARQEAGFPLLGQRRQFVDDSEPHVLTLERLNDWRNRSGEVHRHPTLSLSIGQRIDLLRDVVLFLQWLRRPHDNRLGTFERVYPAVLQLNVLTTNRCGVTSVKYVLRESGDDDESIRLYTQQRVAGIAGVFYGLPVQGRGNSELWVDPVLFSAEAFEDAVNVRDSRK